MNNIVIGFQSDIHVDNRDSNTSWLHLLDGTIIEIKMDFCEWLINNAKENNPEG